MAKEVKNDRKENGYSENVNVRVVYKEFSVLMFMTADAPVPKRAGSIRSLRFIITDLGR
jgi:hypothetical protein